MEKDKGMTYDRFYLDGSGGWKCLNCCFKVATAASSADKLPGECPACGKPRFVKEEIASPVQIGRCNFIPKEVK